LADSVPLVGLTVNWTPNPSPSDKWYGPWRYFLNSSYSDLITGAGAQPLAIVPSSESSLLSLLERLDLVVMTGGGDPDPALYNKPIAGARSPERERPIWEMKVYREALGRGIPVLGICLGMQIMAIESGRPLVQDIPITCVVHEGTMEKPRAHEVRISPDSWLHGVLGSSARVASFHHQAVEEVPDGFRPSAYAGDGVLEAMESTDGLATGLQWHPERDGTGLPILRSLLGRGGAR
jgi:gamma-glutamyl-gamma-aminobutyrate hydrolase PuuD